MIRRNQYVSVHETRAQVTREKLLKAAIKLVNRDGMKQLTVRNICDEAGLSTGSFYNLFSGKEDLISYYLKYAFAPYREKALEGSDEYGPVERVLLLYRAYVEYCKDMGLEFVSGLYASNHNPFFDFMHRDAEDDFIIVSVRNYLAEAIELGIVRDDVDLDEAMLRIAAASTGLLFYWCVFDGDIDIEYEVDEAIKTYLLSITVDPNMKLNIEPLESKGCFLKYPSLSGVFGTRFGVLFCGVCLQNCAMKVHERPPVSCRKKREAFLCVEDVGCCRWGVQNSQTYSLWNRK